MVPPLFLPPFPPFSGLAFLGTRLLARVDLDDVEAPPPFQLILHDLGFAPVQSDGEILVACCLEWVKKDKVANPDAVGF